MSRSTPQVLLVRGHHPTVWGLRAWERLGPRYDVRLMVTGSPRYDVGALNLPRVPVKALRDRLPGGPAGDALALALRDRVLKPDAAFGSADIVHAEELSLWFAAQAARLKRKLGYKLVLTVWETIPLLDAFRSPHARAFRKDTLAHADLFLAASRRAFDGLRLEGVPEEKIRLTYPGIDTAHFSVPPATGVDEHVILSPGRLEWEKGHHDVLRALAALRRGLVPAPPQAVERMRLVLVGSGPERERLGQHAAELGVADRVEFASVPYDDMPALYARASAMVLASLPRSGCTLYPGDIPRCFWEEQFGMVIAESMAAGLPLILASSGAIPEVAGPRADYFAPGDWMAIASHLAEGPLSRAPATRIEHEPERIATYSLTAAAQRLTAAYDELLSASR
ncbi:MAG: phosphatidyl-myo-inositol dimannoside synthase [Solirubrobacteraceae bacterium]|jgi:glycosyltransferase involved in cell wall biosynthesis|nr:phosphatidyl-myo-inositol dimannoside synthase [Solirubrobacteraceae bacterium]